MKSVARDPNSVRAAVSRRTVVGAAAWAAPTIAIATATPAIAASEVPTSFSLVPSTPTLPTVARCSVIANGRVSFTVLADGVPVSDGAIVTVSVTDGLQFVGTPESFSLSLVASGGVVTVPALRAVGAVGTYGVMAAYRDAFASVVVPVDGIAAGTLFTWSQVNNDAPKVLTNPIWPTAKAVAVSDSGYVALTEAGEVYYWGDAFFTSSAAMGKIGGVSGITMVDVWVTHTSDWWAGILYSDGTHVWYANANGRAALSTPVLVAGFTGQVLKVEVHDSATYVLTTDGLFCGGAAVNNGTRNVVAGPVAGSAGATIVDTWVWMGDSNKYTGGAFVATNGSVVVFTADAKSSLIATVQPESPARIRKLRVSDNAIAVLTDDRDLWVSGRAFGVTSFTKHSSEILDFEQWGTSPRGTVWAGMSMLTQNGAVVEHVSNTSGVKKLKTVPGLAGVIVVSLSAADGFYQAMDSTGRIWIWTGNADQSITTPKSLAGQPTSTAAMSAFGIHSSDFWGYGIGIAAAACPV